MQINRSKQITGEDFVQDLCKSLDSIFKKSPARPFNQNVQNPSIKPPSKPLASATPKVRPNQAPSSPISERFPMLKDNK